MAARNPKASVQQFAEDRYARMPYRRCGKSGLKLPAISLGFWQSLGDTGSEETLRQCAYYAFDHGITHFDLANNYGTPAGHSEEVIGDVLQGMPRDELIISTKAGYYMWPGPYGEWGSKKYLVASLEQSLRRMKLEYVDIFYHHRPDPDTPLEESLGALDLLVKQGKALYAGVSSYNGKQFADAVKVIRDHDWTPITIHQPKINLLERDLELDLLPHTMAWGTGVIAFCPLAQGRLSDKYLNGLPADSRMGRRGADGQKWYESQKSAGIWDKVAKLNALATNRRQTLPQMALAWLLRYERITSVLIGASKVEQLAENLKAIDSPPFTQEELRKIDQITAA
jgi:L-glyceraldehyde 3-phosphate reductase